MAERFQLFRSAISSEFCDYREALHGRLTRPNLTIAIQEDLSACIFQISDYLFIETFVNGEYPPRRSPSRVRYAYPGYAC